MAIIDLRDPQGKYGADFQAAAAILKAFGQVEKDRQERQQMNTLMQGLAAGQDLQTIMANIQSQGPQFSGGLGGIGQRIGAAVMPKGPSQTEGILAQLGLAQAAPQAKANLAATEARTAATKQQTEASRQGMRQQAAEAPARQEGQALDLETRHQELAESRLRLRNAEQMQSPAMQRYQHYARQAELAFNQLRYSRVKPGDPGYDELVGKLDEAQQQMEAAWLEHEGRTPPPTEIQPLEQPQAPAPEVGTGAASGPAVAQMGVGQQAPSQQQVIGQASPTPPQGATPAGRKSGLDFQQQTAPLPGLTDIWPKIPEEERAELWQVHQQLVEAGDMGKLMAWRRKVRELVK